jgi:hypothetical protein
VKLNDQSLGDADLLLACLNCTIQLSDLKGFQANPILRELGEAIRNELRMIGAEIRHLKMTLAAEVDLNGVATLNVSRPQQPMELGPELDEPLERGKLDLNLRANAKPDHLHAAVTRAMNHTWSAFPNLFVRLAQMEHFGSGPSPAAGIAGRIPK